MSGYVIEKATIGHLKQVEVSVVRMPRERFLEIVDGLLNESDPGLREELRPVAESMSSYPLGEWINEERGCGCVVGEYLVASSEMGRAGLVDGPSIQCLLSEKISRGDALLVFGEEIDRRMKAEVRTQDEDGWSLYPTAVLIEDEA